MSNNTTLMLNLERSLNRAIVYTAFPMSKPVNFTIYHHKITSAIQFDVDTKSKVIKSQEVLFSVYRNLDNCSFCRTFLTVENMKNERHDYQNKFTGLNKSKEKYVAPFIKEKLDLNIQDDNKPSLNYLIVFGWKLYDLDDELLFYFVQRKCYNKITRTHIIRTAGLQFATKKGIKALDAYTNDSDNSIRKVTVMPDFLIGKGDVSNEFNL